MESEEYIIKVKKLKKRPQKTGYHVKFNKVKMNDRVFTALSLFKHIGEVKFFDFIVNRVVRNDELLYYHNEESIKAFRLSEDLSDSTLHNYLKHMINEELIRKLRNGVYEVNDKYVKVTSKFTEENETK